MTKEDKLDMFAAAALTGYITQLHHNTNINVIISYAYSAAKAMIKESERRNKQE